MFLALFAASGALSFVFQTRYMGLLCPLVVLLVPLISIFLWIYNKTQKIRYADKIRRYVLGLRIAAITGWCLSLLPGLFWGAILFHIFEPWPFSLSQGPDTVYAIEGFKKVLGFEPSAEIDQIFYKGYEIRDYDRYLRFHTCDNAVEEIVVHDLEKVNDGSNVAAHHLNERLSWWFEIPEAIELEHWREEFRVIWLDRRTCTFYVRSWTT
jgi:hypothetical protein